MFNRFLRTHQSKIRLLVCSATLFATTPVLTAAKPPIPPQSVPQLDEVEESPFISGFEAWSFIAPVAFGVQISDSFLEVDEPLHVQGERLTSSQGVTLSGLDFELHTAFMVEVQLPVLSPQDQVQMPNLRLWSWCGLLQGPSGVVPCGGYYASSDNFHRFIPLATWKDQNRGLNAISQMFNRYQPRVNNCALLIQNDRRARMEDQLGQQAHDACDASRWSDFLTGFAIVCVGGAGLACVVSFGLACWGIPICFIAGGGVAINFADKNAIEVSRFNSCLCTTAESRSQNPDVVTPTCVFTCPPLLPFK